MARLNKQVKEQILNNALKKAGVFEREAKLVQSKAKLAESVRLFAVGGKAEECKLVKIEKKIKDLIGTIPKCVDIKGNFRFDENHGIKASFGGRQFILYYSGGKDEGEDRVFKTLSPCMYGDPVKLPVDHELCVKFDEIQLEEKTVKDLKTSITLNVNAMVNSVTTDKKLVEIWPESKELIPDDAGATKINLPTTNVESLNAMIGIPSEKS
ncbi:hypothetical protein vBVpPvVp04M_00004 [Vibrio phage vB_Vp_PvVp04_M]|nr:hypothetical protein vBVpPvVp04M_00004 [Vibrio phage vB_Vp_PvVp04_M]